MALTSPNVMFQPSDWLNYITYNFSEALQLWNTAIGTSPTSPFYLTNLEIMMGGQYIESPTFVKLQNLVREPNIANPSGAVTPLALGTISAKGFRKWLQLSPVETTRIVSARLAGLKDGDLEAEYGKQFADQLKSKMQLLCTAVAFGVLNCGQRLGVIGTGGLTGQAPDHVYDGLDKHMSLPLLVEALGVLGDQFGNFDKCRYWLMNSKEAVHYWANSVQISGDGRFAPQSALQMEAANSGDALGLSSLKRPIITLDNLYTADSTAATRGSDDIPFGSYGEVGVSYGLGSQFIKLEITEPLGFANEQNINNQELPSVVQTALLEVSVQVPGFAWQGGANPTIAQMALPTNWAKTYSDAREIPAIEIVHKPWHA